MRGRRHFVLHRKATSVTCYESETTSRKRLWEFEQQKQHGCMPSWIACSKPQTQLSVQNMMPQRAGTHELLFLGRVLIMFFFNIAWQALIDQIGPATRSVNPRTVNVVFKPKAVEINPWTKPQPQQQQTSNLGQPQIAITTNWDHKQPGPDQQPRVSGDIRGYYMVS